MKTKKSSLKLTVAEKAYIAGIIDGEGCIGLFKNKDISYKRGYSYSVITQIAVTDKKLINWIFKKIKSGHRYSSNTNPQKHKTIFVIRFSVNDSKILLKLIKPYLIIKKKQADILLRFISRKQQARGCKGLTNKELTFQDKCYQQIKKLKREG
jgi:hypothetical protein